jgi:hypothetical protein
MAGDEIKVKKGFGKGKGIKTNTIILFFSRLFVPLQHDIEIRRIGYRRWTCWL